MLHTFKITNFKSIDEICMDLQKLNFIVGMNGAGKSTILQALDFTSQLMKGDIQSWLANREWDFKDLRNQNNKNRKFNIDIEIFLDHYDQDVEKLIVWKASFSTRDLFCRSESIYLYDVNLDNYEPVMISYSGIIEIIGGREYIDDVTGLTKDDISNKNFKNNKKDTFALTNNYHGSILSSLKEDYFNSYMKHVKHVIGNITSLELLSPATLRKRSRLNKDILGIGGEKLAGRIAELKISHQESFENIQKELKIFYPHLQEIDIKNLVSGWKQLIFMENYSNSKLTISAKHINDGMLRILAIITQVFQSNSSVILLDEIENGINQEIIKPLVRTLAEVKNVQFVITTHSPLLLNYLTDTEAEKGLFFSYKASDGNMKIRKFFEVIDEPEMLEYTGPGEIFVNTDLKELALKCENLDIKEAKR